MTIAPRKGEQKLERIYDRITRDIGKLRLASCWDITFNRQREMMAVIRTLADDRIKQLEGAEQRLRG